MQILFNIDQKIHCRIFAGYVFFYYLSHHRNKSSPNRGISSHMIQIEDDIVAPQKKHSTVLPKTSITLAATRLWRGFH